MYYTAVFENGHRSERPEGPRAGTPRISVVLPIRNRAGFRFENCLRSLRAQEGLALGDIEIVVSDFGSDDEAARHIAKVARENNASVVRTATRGQWNRSLALNIGIRAASAPWILCTDVDMIFSSNFVATVLAQLESSSHPTIVTCHTHDLPPDAVDGIYRPETLEELISVATVRPSGGTGACQAFAADWVREVRGYDEKYVFWGFEDKDMIARAAKAGLEQVWVSDKTAMLHQWHRQTSADQPLRKRLNQWRYYLTKGIVVKNRAGWGEQSAAESSGSLLSHTLWRLAQVLSGGGFGAIFALIYVTELERTEFGVYGLALTVSQLCRIGANFGLRATVNRFVATARGALENSSIRGYVRAGLAASVAATAVTLLLFGGATPWLTDLFAGSERVFTILLLVIFLVAANGISLTIQGALEGLGRFKDVMLINLCVNSAQLLLLGALFLVGFEVSLVLAIEVCVTVAGALGYGFRLRVLCRELPPPEDGLRRYLRPLLLMAAPILINAIGGFLYTKVDMLFVKAYLTYDDLADYFLMSYIFNFPLQALGAYIYVLNTEVSVSYGARKIARIRALFWRSERVALFIGVGLALLFFGCSFVVEWILPEYGGAAHLMRLISPLIAVKCLTHIASGAFLVSLGRAKMLMTFTLVGGGVNMLLNWALIPLFGVDGAVYSTLIGHTASGLATATYIVIILSRLKPEET
jgi:O-antigen/teichoic acid export membrane protein